MTIGFFRVLLAPDNNSRLRQHRLCSFMEDLCCLCALCVVHACVYRMHTCIYVCDYTRLFFYMRSVFDCYLVVLIAILLFEAGR